MSIGVFRALSTPPVFLPKTINAFARVMLRAWLDPLTVKMCIGH